MEYGALYHQARKLYKMKISGYNIEPGANLQNANLYGASLQGANLQGTNLQGANLRDADLYGASLQGADLQGASLSGANLQGANLYGASLQGANLQDANLQNAKLCRANLQGTNLQCADLQGANLRDANLKGADLQNADLYGASLQDANLQCAQLRGARLPDFQLLQEGELIGWKKVRGDIVLRLRVTGKRTATLTSNKCRADKVVVEAAFNMDGTQVEGSEFYSIYDKNFIYIVGQEVSEPNYNPDPRVECTGGIHFFKTQEEAVSWDPIIMLARPLQKIGV